MSKKLKKRGEIGLNEGEGGLGGKVGGWEIKWVPGGGPRENPRSLSSPKAEKFLAVKIIDGPTDGRTDGPTEGLILSARSRIKIPWLIKHRVFTTPATVKNVTTTFITVALISVPGIRVLKR